MSKNLTVLVPVYNEEATLPTLMDALHAACPDAEVIYIDDGSEDRSLEILHRLARAQDVVLEGRHGGKGSAIRLGLEEAKGTYTVIQDADLEYDPKEIHLLLDAALSHGRCAVFGSRFLKQNPNIYKGALFGNKLLTWWLDFLFKSKVTDSYTCYKLLPTNLFQGLNLRSNGFELEAEIAAKCLKTGIDVIEIPVNYRPRRIEEGKKINWKDGIKGLVMMTRIRLAPSPHTLRHDPKSENHHTHKHAK